MIFCGFRLQTGMSSVVAPGNEQDLTAGFLERMYNILGDRITHYHNILFIGNSVVCLGSFLFFFLISVFNLSPFSVFLAVSQEDLRAGKLYISVGLWSRMFTFSYQTFIFVMDSFCFLFHGIITPFKVL